MIILGKEQPIKGSIEQRARTREKSLIEEFIKTGTSKRAPFAWERYFASIKRNFLLQMGGRFNFS
jgi:hypothetical protein